MTIAGEMLTDGFEIYVASIVSWDDSDGGLIGEIERQRIPCNVKSSLESQGAKVVLTRPARSESVQNVPRFRSAHLKAAEDTPNLVQLSADKRTLIKEAFVYLGHWRSEPLMEDPWGV
jgi:hypothetical protein